MNRNDHAWAAGLHISRALLASAATEVASKVPLSCTLQLCDIWKVRRAPFFLAVAIGAAIPFLFTNNAAAAKPKRVLIVHSFGRAAPPLTVHSFA